MYRKVWKILLPFIACVPMFALAGSVSFISVIEGKYQCRERTSIVLPSGIWVHGRLKLFPWNSDFSYKGFLLGRKRDPYELISLSYLRENYSYIKDSCVSGYKNPSLCEVMAMAHISTLMSHVSADFSSSDKENICKPTGRKDNSGRCVVCKQF